MNESGICFFYLKKYYFQNIWEKNSGREKKKWKIGGKREKREKNRWGINKNMFFWGKYIPLE